MNKAGGLVGRSKEEVERGVSEGEVQNQAIQDRNRSTGVRQGGSQQGQWEKHCRDKALHKVEPSQVT